MLRVGLTGGYATGKSFVASELERLGCKIIYADKLGHEVLLPSSDGFRPVVELFGDSILDSEGLIDRKKLGQIVFGRPDLLKQLTAIVHPLVYRLEAARIVEYAAADPHAIIVTEAAILVETGRYKSFDRLIVTVCSTETQVARGIKRDGLTREQVLERISNQIPSAERQKYAHYVVDTDQPKTETSARVLTIYEDLKRIAALS